MCVIIIIIIIIISCVYKTLVATYGESNEKEKVDKKDL